MAETKVYRGSGSSDGTTTSSMNERVLKLKLLSGNTPENTTVFVLGATGCGKTTLIANLLRTDERFVVFDIRSEFEAEFFHGCCYVSTIQELADCMNNGIDKIIFRGDGSEETLDSFLSYILAFQLSNKHLGSVTIVIDELNKYVERSKCPQSIKEVVQRGRIYGIKKLFGAQWFATIPTWTRDSFSEIYAFRHTDKNGLNLLETYGIDSVEVSQLMPRQCLHLFGGTLERISLVADSPIKTNRDETKEEICPSES